MTISMLDRSASRTERRTADRATPQGSAAATAHQREGLLEQVIVLNIGVAHAIAHRYRNRSIPVEDLEQVACMALVRAAQKFDVSQDRDFLTYAVPTISGELKRHFRDHGWTIRPPRRVQEIQSKVINAFHHGQESGSQPSPAKLAAELGLPETDVAEALQAEGCFTPVSLDVPVTDDGRAAIDRLTDDDDTDTKAMEARLDAQPGAAQAEPARPPDPPAALRRGQDAAGDRRRARRHPDAGLAPPQADPRDPARRARLRTRCPPDA